MKAEYTTDEYGKAQDTIDLYTNFLLPYKWDYEEEHLPDGPGFWVNGIKEPIKGNELTRIRNGQRSEMRMNDYRWGRVRGTDGSLRRMSYEDYLKWFDKSFAAIKKVVEDNPDKEIVVVTFVIGDTINVDAEVDDAEEGFCKVKYFYD